MVFLKAALMLYTSLKVLYIELNTRTHSLVHQIRKILRRINQQRRNKPTISVNIKSLSNTQLSARNKDFYLQYFIYSNVHQCFDD